MAEKRQSNIELLRILAMFMILVIHANMISLPKPLHADLLSSPIPCITRYFIESLGIVGVNLFVMISGWFLIRTRAKSFLSFIFQILYFWGGVLIVGFILGKIEISKQSVMEMFFFTRWDWFIKSYIVLMILAPVLNTYIEHSSEKTQRHVLISFFLFSCTYGWIGGASRFFVNGYGPLLFIGLYLLAHYVRTESIRNKETSVIRRLFSFNKYIDLLIFIFCAVINTLLGIAGLYSERNVYSYVFAYINPITIIAALYLFLYFSKLKIRHNACINFLAAGSFAVYLFHSQVDVRPFFSKGALYLYEHHSNLLCISAVFFYLILWYVGSVIIDYPRQKIWTIISNKYNIR